jgi:hypothetical protein
MSLYHLGRFIESMDRADNLIDQAKAAIRFRTFAEEIQNELTAFYYGGSASGQAHRTDSNAH